MRKSINHPLLALAGVGIVAALLAASPAQAAHHSTQWHIQHYIECLGLMGSPTHTAKCGPGHEWTGKFSEAVGFEAPPPAPPVTTETPAPCVPPPCIPPHCWPRCRPPCEKPGVNA